MNAGIYELGAADYHADPCASPSLSASIAHTLVTRSPLHAWTQHPKLNPDFRREEEPKFDRGTVSHALLLEGRNAVEVVDADSWRSNAAKEARDDARANGKTPMLAKDWEAVWQMVEAARSQVLGVDASPPIFRDGRPEQTIVWQEGDVTCRALVDWLRDDRTAVDDYKTTAGSANPEQWTRTMFGIGADIQAAFYLRGLERLTGRRPDWRFVVQETFPPYALSVVSLAPSVLEIADAKVDYALAVWERCITTGVWPGYPRRVAYAELPAWEESRWLEREAREAA